MRLNFNLRILTFKSESEFFILYSESLLNLYSESLLKSESDSENKVLSRNSEIKVRILRLNKDRIKNKVRTILSQN